MTSTKIINTLIGQDNYPDRVCALVKEMVSGYYGLPLSAYNTKNRKRETIKLKQATVYFIRNLLPTATLFYIGKQVGYDHATVLHHLKVIKAAFYTNGETKKEIEEMSKAVHLKQDMLTVGDTAHGDYYFANFDKCTTLKLPNGQFIALTGMLPNQIEAITKLLSDYYNITLTPRKHTDTGLFVFERLDKEAQ
jgi:hypothetical protein